MPWTLFSSTSTSNKNMSTTDIKTNDVDFSWTIKNFDFHEAIANDLTSSTFSATTSDKCNWHLLLSFNDSEGSDEEVSIDLCSNFTEGLQSVFVKFGIHFMIQKIKVWSAQSAVHEFSRASPNYGWSHIPKKQILSENEVTIRCHVTFSDGNNVCINLSLRPKPEISECSLLKIFASLLQNREFSDVTISVKNKDYPVHKCILAARSPVFAAMFKHEMKENQMNRVNIEGMDENVIDEMLRYIYTGTCENLDSIAEGLLAAADKYALDGLKTICLDKLRNSLSVENAARILLLSEMHGASELKKKVIEYIVDDPKNVCSTDGWKNMLSNPALIDEVCRAMALRMVSLVYGCLKLLVVILALWHILFYKK